MDSTAINYEEFCTNWLGAWTGNNAEGLIQYYTENAYYSDPANPSGIRGREQLLKYFKKLLSKNPDWIWTAVEIIPTQKGFTLKWRATILVKQASISVYGLDIVEMEGARISRNEVYFDTAPWMALLSK
jgi:hypothetical protein